MPDHNKKEKCKVCRKSFELSKMRGMALTSYQTESEKHKHLMKERTLLVTNQMMSVVKSMRNISSKQLLKFI